MTDQSDHDIRQLMQIAGQRQTPGEQVSAEVFAAVEKEWEQSLAKRRMIRRGYFAMAASILIVAGAFLVSYQPAITTTASPLTAELLRVDGIVEIETAPSEWYPLISGQRIELGHKVRTGNGRVAMALAGQDTQVRLNKNSQIHWLTDKSLILEQGMVYVDADDNNANKLTITAGEVQVTHVGTQFLVDRTHDELKVAVREGKVIVRQSAIAQEASGGSSLSVRDGSFSPTKSIPASAAEWVWVQQVTPELNLDGMTVYDFLMWFQRESATPVTFQSSSTRLQAKTVTLSGSTKGLTAQKAADIILSGTRFTHQWQNDELLIGLDGN